MWKCASESFFKQLVSHCFRAELVLSSRCSSWGSMNTTQACTRLAASVGQSSRLLFLSFGAPFVFLLILLTMFSFSKKERRNTCFFSSICMQRLADKEDHKNCVPPPKKAAEKLKFKNLLADAGNAGKLYPHML